MGVGVCSLPYGALMTQNGVLSISVANWGIMLASILTDWITAVAAVVAAVGVVVALLAFRQQRETDRRTRTADARFAADLLVQRLHSVVDQIENDRLTTYVKGEVAEILASVPDKNARINAESLARVSGQDQLARAIDDIDRRSNELIGWLDQLQLAVPEVQPLPGRVEDETEDQKRAWEEKKQREFHRKEVLSDRVKSKASQLKTQLNSAQDLVDKADT